MNKERRNRLAKIQDIIEGLIAEVEEIHGEEEEAYENLPESLQETERGESMERAIDNLEDLQQNLEEAAETINEITEA